MQKIRPQMFYRLLVLALIGLAQYYIWFDQQGMSLLRQLRAKAAQKEHTLVLLQQQNQQLQEEINFLLQHSEEALELQARRSFGMIEEGERYWQVKETGKPPSLAPAADLSPAAYQVKH